MLSLQPVESPPAEAFVPPPIQSSPRLGASLRGRALAWGGAVPSLLLGAHEVEAFGVLMYHRITPRPSRVAAPTWNVGSHFNSLDMGVSAALAAVSGDLSAVAMMRERLADGVGPGHFGRYAARFTPAEDAVATVPPNAFLHIGADFFGEIGQFIHE